MRISFIELHNFPFRTTDRCFLFRIESHSEIIIEKCNSGGGEYSELITTPNYFSYRVLCRRMNNGIYPTIDSLREKEYAAYKRYTYYDTHIL
jgi:hypothetical protein